jgi:ferredoxin
MPFTVELARSGTSVEVPPGTSMLEALLGVTEVDFSCRRGECGTCVQKVVEGIPLHRDTVLSPRAKEAGKRIAVCVSRSQTPVLVLDL